MKKIAFALTAVAMIAGCSGAKKASEVTPAYVSTTTYTSLSCSQLNTEAENIRRMIPALEGAVDKHREQQTGVEVVTWVLFWPAAFLLDKGEAQSSQLARARGELEAVNLAIRQNKC